MVANENEALTPFGDGDEGERLCDLSSLVDENVLEG
jgi:hypothetical protein